MARKFGGVLWATRPSQDSVLSFTQPSEVREILVKPDEAVKKGQVLVRARDADILAAIATQRVRSSNEAEVKGAATALELAQFRYDQYRKAAAENAKSSPSEEAELRLSVDNARHQLDAARARLKEEQLRLETLERQLERYRLEAPFDGRVESVMVEQGQGLNEAEKVVRVVNTDLLWVEAPVPTDETLRLGLKTDSSAWVMLVIGDSVKVVRGRVLHVSPVADMASGTRRVRVEIANPSRWPAGTPAAVRFEEPVADWSSVATGRKNP
ncbi:MAG: efflux RND transporter periplasmic adaptor subunit [Phycisphaerae bacterium]|nr:efflux RND transporter periplasmic adaptor subunit [Phycisphaerae bacterium]